MKKLLITVAIVCLAHYFSNAQSLNESDLPSNGVTHQIGPGSNNSVKAWTYPYGVKLSVYEGVNRNFEIMNTHKGATSTLAFRTYDGNSNQWTGWREMLFRDSQKRMRFPVKSFFAPQVSNFDGDLLLQSSNIAQVGNYGAALAFSKVAGGVTRRAAIASKQTGADEDHVGLAFFTHGGVSTDDLIESMVIDGAGRVGIGTANPNTKLEIYQYDGTSQLRLHTNQHAGTAKLEIAGGSAFLDSNPNNYSGWSIYHSHVNTNRDLYFRHGESGDPNFILSDDGKVGIGSTSPYSKLDVVDIKNSGEHLMTVRNHTVSTNSSSGIALINSTANGAISGARLISKRRTSGVDVDFNVQLYDGVGMNQRLTILGTNGNVGIGTANPNTKLEINGSAVAPLGDNNATTSMVFSGTNNWKGMVWTDQNGNGRKALRYDQQSGFLVFSDLTASGHYNNRLVLHNNGNVGIGTDNPDSKLTIDGGIHSQEVIVDIEAGTGPDYVFEEDYNLISLEETKAYIQENKHLPEVPSAKVMESEGVELRDMSLLLLKKIEEMTLHQIELMEEVKALKAKVKELEK